MATAVQQTTKTAETDALAELQRDLNADDAGCLARNAKAERRLAKVERDLAEPRHRAAAYRRLVLQSDLPSNVVRLLCCLTETFGARLENCFPGRRNKRLMALPLSRPGSVSNSPEFLRFSLNVMKNY